MNHVVVSVPDREATLQGVHWLMSQIDGMRDTTLVCESWDRLAYE